MGESILTRPIHIEEIIQSIYHLMTRLLFSMGRSPDSVVCRKRSSEDRQRSVRRRGTHYPPLSPSREDDLSLTVRKPRDCAILIVDNSYGYGYVTNLGGYVRLRTSEVRPLIKERVKKYTLVADNSPIVPDSDKPIIDDGDYYRGMITKALRVRGYNVAEAPQGYKEAMAMINSTPYDLIVVGSEIIRSAGKKPDQQTTVLLLDYISAKPVPIPIMLTTPSQSIVPLDSTLEQRLKENAQNIVVVEKPYEISMDLRNANNNVLLNAIRNKLGIRL